jgi:hypothetical protein
VVQLGPGDDQVLTLAAVLMLLCAALLVRACWPRRSKEETRIGAAHASGHSREAAARADVDVLNVDGAYRRHAWSERRPRLELTESGMRYTGHEVRFCLDCPAEKSVEQASTENGPL